MKILQDVQSVTNRADTGRKKKMNKLKVKDLGKGGKLLPPAKEGDAGYDIVTPTDIQILPGQRKLIEVGFALEIPDGYVALIKEKSGLAVKKGLQVMGGVIDAGYRGEIKVCLYNSNLDDSEKFLTEMELHYTKNHNALTFDRGDKIAQIIFQKVETPKIEMVEELSKSERADTGFGSSGK